MFGRIGSLNAAVAAAVGLYTLRQHMVPRNNDATS
jgi:tRNA G18 (ribose-2'-O)-methylase SpoU